MTSILQIDRLAKQQAVCQTESIEESKYLFCNLTREIYNLYVIETFCRIATTLVAHKEYVSGDVAQMGERLVRNEKARGSIPLVPTIYAFMGQGLAKLQSLSSDFMKTYSTVTKPIQNQDHLLYVCWH